MKFVSWGFIMDNKRVLVTAFMSGAVFLGVCEGNLSFAAKKNAEIAMQMLNDLPKKMEPISLDYTKDCEKLLAKGNLAQKTYFGATEREKDRAAEQFLQTMVYIYNNVESFQKVVEFKKVKSAAEYKQKLEEEKENPGFLNKRLEIEKKQKINNLNNEDWSGILADLKNYDDNIKYSKKIEDVQQCHKDLEEINKRYDELLSNQRRKEYENQQKAAEVFVNNYTKVIGELDAKYKITSAAKERRANKKLAPIQSEYDDVVDDLRNALAAVKSYEDMTLFENKIFIAKESLYKIKESEEKALVDINGIKNRNGLIELSNNTRKALVALKNGKADFGTIAPANSLMKVALLGHMRRFSSYTSGKTFVRPEMGEFFTGPEGLGKTFTTEAVGVATKSDVTTCKIAEYAEDPAGFLKFYQKCLDERVNKSKVIFFIFDDVDGVLKAGTSITKAVRKVIDDERDKGTDSRVIFVFTANTGVKRNKDGVWEADPELFAPEILRVLRVFKLDYPSKEETIKTLKKMFAIFGVSKDVPVEKVADALMASGKLRTPAKINELMNSAATYARNENLELKSGKRLDDSASTFEEDIDFDNLDNPGISSVSADADLSDEDWKINTDHMKKALKKIGAGDLD